MRLGKARNHVPVLLEVDVTEARAALGRRKQQGGPDVSFTAWVVKCIAQAAAEHRRVHAVRGRRWGGRGPALARRTPVMARAALIGRRTLVTFADVDMSLAVYRRLTGDDAGDRLPMPFVVRKVNEKSLEELSSEIRAAQSRPLPQDQQWLEPDGLVPPLWLLRLAVAAPARLRDWLYWDRLLGDPFRVKKTMGTVMVTSVPLTSKSGGGAWGIPTGIHPLLVALGAIGRRPGHGRRRRRAARDAQHDRALRPRRRRRPARGALPAAPQRAHGRRLLALTLAPRRADSGPPSALRLVPAGLGLTRPGPSARVPRTSVCWGTPNSPHAIPASNPWRSVLRLEIPVSPHLRATLGAIT